MGDVDLLSGNRKLLVATTSVLLSSIANTNDSSANARCLLAIFVARRIPWDLFSRINDHQGPRDADTIGWCLLSEPSPSLMRCLSSAYSYGHFHRGVLNNCPYQP